MAPAIAVSSSSGGCRVCDRRCEAPVQQRAYGTPTARSTERHRTYKFCFIEHRCTSLYFLPFNFLSISTVHLCSSCYVVHAAASILYVKEFLAPSPTRGRKANILTSKTVVHKWNHEIPTIPPRTQRCSTRALHSLPCRPKTPCGMDRQKFRPPLRHHLVPQVH